MVYDPRGGGTTHIDRLLTNISVEYPNNEFVGDVLFSTVDVPVISDKYRIHDPTRALWGPPTHDSRAPGAVANEIPGMQASTDTYFAQEHSLQTPVTDEERQNVDAPLDPDRDATNLVTSKILLGRELAIRDKATTAANYPSAHVLTLSGTNQWDSANYATSNPIANFRTAIRQIHSVLFLRPNLAIIPWRVMSELSDHPDFIERFKYSERGIMTEEMIAAVIGIPRVVIPEAGHNTAVPPANPSTTYIWGNDVVVAYVNPRPGLRSITYGIEFNWGYSGRTPQVIDRWREIQRKSDLVRCSRRYDLKFIAVDSTGDSVAGFLLENVIP